MADLHAIHRAIAIARRRLFVQRWLDRTGWCLLGGVAAATAVLMADRLAAVPVPWPVYAAVAGAAVLAATVMAMIGQPSSGQVAIAVDERLHLKDKLSTALYATTLADDPLAPTVIRDAQTAAASAKVREGFPLRLGRVWGWLPVAGAVLALLFALVKPMDLLGLAEARRVAQVEAQQAAEAQEKLVEAVAAIEQLQQEEGTLDEINPLSAMQEAANLTQRELTNPEYRQKAAAKLSAVQDKLEQAEQQKAREFEALQNTLSRMDAGQPGPADRFADALRRGDFEAAKDALQQLADNVGDMPADQQQALKQQLDNLAQQLDDAAKQAQAQQAQTQQNIQQQLSEAGLSQQQIQQAQQQGYNAQHLQQLLQQQGMSQQQAQQMAQNIQQQQQQSQSQGQCQSQCNGLGQSLQQMANSINPSRQGQQGQQGQGQQPGQGMQSGAWQGQQQISDMAKMQQQLQQLRQGQQQTQQAMNQLNQQGQGGGQGQGQGQQGSQPGQGGGVGGREAGTGDGGNPFGQERTYQPNQVDAYGNISEGEGRIIASWMQKGEAAAGEATVEFNTAVTEARDQAERAIADDRVPARYHGAVREYFQQMPTSMDDVQRAPAAPR